jgi:hypothetical protein
MVDETMAIRRLIETPKPVLFRNMCRRVRATS